MNRRTVYQIVGTIVLLSVVMATVRSCTRGGTTANPAPSTATPASDTAPAATAPANASQPTIVVMAAPDQTSDLKEFVQAVSDTGGGVILGRKLTEKHLESEAEQKKQSQITSALIQAKKALEAEAEAKKKKASKLQADIKEIRRRLEDRERGLEICERVARESTNMYVRRQAETDCRRNERMITDMQDELDKKNSELERVLQ